MKDNICSECREKHTILVDGVRPVVFIDLNCKTCNGTGYMLSKKCKE